MKVKIKRFLAIICCITLFITSFSVIDMKGGEARAQSSGNASTEISITDTFIAFWQGGGYVNVAYSGMQTDYVGPAGNFLDETFVNDNVTFDGGLTYEEFKSGLTFSNLATRDIMQFNWSGRGRGFAEGAAFTIKQGAKLPYTASSGTKYVTLDADYTFTFGAPIGSGQYNTVTITKQKTSTFSLNVLELIANGTKNSEVTGTIFFGADSTITAYNTIYRNIESEASYAEYIDFAGRDYTTLAQKGVKIRYLLDGASMAIQIESFGTLREELQIGEKIIFRKGLPIQYTTVDGASMTAKLDNDYIYECIAVDTGAHDQVFAGLKYNSEGNTYGLASGSFTTALQGTSEQFINVGLTNTIAIDSGYVQDDLLSEPLAKEFIDIAGYTVEEAKEMGIVFRFIPTANVIQMGFQPDAVKKLQVGDKIMLKKGLPIVYDRGNNVLDCAHLNDGYSLTVKSNDGTSLTFSCEIAGSFALSTNIFAYYSDVKYANIEYAQGAFADAAEFQGVLDATVMKDYFEVSGKSYDELVSQGYQLWGFYVSALKGLRFTCTTFDLQTGDTVLFKKGLPITYITDKGSTKTAYLEKDYGYRYAGNGLFNYDPEIKDEPEQMTDSFGLDTSVTATAEEETNQVTNITITNNPFAFESYYWKNLSEDSASTTFIDYSECANAEIVKANTMIQFTLASADVQVIQVKFAPKAVENISVGDRILLKKDMPVPYKGTNPEAIATLDDNYQLTVVAKEDNKVTLKTELTGTYSLVTDVFYHTENYMDIRSGANDFADAEVFADVKLDNQVLKEFFQISDQTYETLMDKGYGILAFNLPALKGLKVTYDSFGLNAGDCLLVKKGLPITYTTTAGKTRTVYLDDNYGYIKNDQTAFVYDPTIDEIKEPEITYFGLASECGSFEEGGFTKFNLSFADGPIAVTNYIQPDIMTNTTVWPYIQVKNHTVQELLNCNFKILFVPSVGVLQFNLGSLALDEGDEILLKKGMTISYNDNGPKKVILDDDYTYQVQKGENDVKILTRISSYDVKITVDKVERLNEKCRVGTKLDLSQYVDETKGKVMTIQVNGVSTQDKKLVVTENMDIVIENRSDICIVVFKDGNVVCAVREYLLTDDKMELPYAPDKDGYEDSWESFQLKNGVIEVQAIHQKKVVKPIVQLTEEDYGGTYASNNQGTNGENVSPVTGDTLALYLWFTVCLGMVATIALIVRKKRG